MGNGGLGESLARVAALPTGQHGLRVRAGRPAETEDGWFGCVDLLASPAALRAWGTAIAAWLTDRYGEAPPRTVAGYLLTWYLAVPGQAAALLFHTARRVPSLRQEDLAVRLADARPKPVEVAVLADEFVCLPSDPAAGEPGTRVVADDDALAAVLRGRFAGHAARFIAAFRSAFGGDVRFGRQTLWAAATDALDEACWFAGLRCAEIGVGAANAARVLPAALPPFTSASRLRPAVTPSAETDWTRRRESCCFHYVLARGFGPCSTCPRTACSTTPAVKSAE
jgi:hypothetical protein